jgi:DNA-binding MarR family transcriptional regulator
LRNIPPSERPDRRSPRALDMRAFLPSAIMLLAQKIAASASAAYRPRFGVGLTDWRVIAALGAEPWIAPARVVELSGLDKAAVSRSLGVLRAAGWVESEGQPTQRGGPHALTPAGLELHDRLVEAASERERGLMAGFSAQERALFADFVRRMGEAADGA